jgi:hypothetical protein
MSELILTTTDNDNAHITFYTDQTEMFALKKDGFYVRGIKVSQDENEAEKVYTAFKSWLVWASLNREY